MTLGRWLLLLGFVCLAVVVLSHVAEKLDVLPSMGWGSPDSPAHHLDLASAVLGCVFLITGIVLSMARDR
jgi:preprotein translocase subunit SecG